jgi:hypothetical protein
MIEIKNSKTTYLGRISGAERYSLDAFIGAVQMREPGGSWQDIKPRLIRDSSGWHVEGAPYYAEVKDDGTRLFCPDKYERSKYIRFLPHPLYAALGKAVTSKADKLTKQAIPSAIRMESTFGSLEFLFTNTGMYLPMTVAGPMKVEGKAVDCLTFDIDTNLDIEALLKAKEGLGILPAHLLDAKENESLLEWTYKNGQLEFGFEIKEYPARLVDAIDIQVGAGADDGYWTSGYNYSNNFDRTLAGRSYDMSYNSWYRYDGITIPQGAAIDVAYLTFYDRSSMGSPETKIYADDQNDPAAPTNWADVTGRTPTTAGVDWDGDPGGGWVNSPPIVDVIQELVDSYDYSNEAIQILHLDDGSANNGDIQDFYAYDNTDDGLGARASYIHIEYSTGGATEKISADAVSGADGSALLADIIEGESGDGAEAGPSLLVGLAKADIGSGTEQSLLSFLLTSFDSGAGIEAVAASLAEHTKGDSGSDTEDISGRSLTLPDFGCSSDMISALITAIVAAETGSGIEQSVLSSIVAKLAAETGSGADAAEMVAGIIASETGLGNDTGMIVGLKQLLSSDIGISIDALKALIGTSKTGLEMKLPGRAGRSGIPSRGVNL